jgi:hypothetical protein
MAKVTDSRIRSDFIRTNVIREKRKYFRTLQANIDCLADIICSHHGGM